MFHGGNRAEYTTWGLVAPAASMEGWEISGGGVTGSALHLKSQSGCCVEIILKWSKSGNKDHLGGCYIDVSKR